MSYKQNLPNAAKLVMSLRQLDYTNFTAIADLVDNSIDAGASHIWIDVSPNKERGKKESEIAQIIIADDGEGMDFDVLDEALKLGSDTDKNSSYDLGLYGMGLVTASISMGKRLEVLSKTKKGKVLKSVQDLDVIIEQNEFVKDLEEANEEEAGRFYQSIRKSSTATEDSVSGTVVIISAIDHADVIFIKAFCDKLSQHLGQTFRKFLKSSSSKIFIQGIDITPIDPIYNFNPKILLEDDVKLEEGSIKVVIAEIEDYGQEINRQKGVNIPNQGFYGLRNNREIFSGESLGIFAKHNSLNTLRIELSYPGTMDKILGSNFAKSRISLNQSISDKLERICNPFIKQIRDRKKKERSDNKDHKEDFTEAEKFITQKSHLLKKPTAEQEKRSQGEGGTGRVKPTLEGSPRLNITKRKRVSVDSLAVKFDYRTLGEKGPIYESDQEGKMILIYWNTDHPFYQSFIGPHSDDPNTINPIVFLVYSLANAELIAKDGSDSEEILENIRYDVGRNLAVLLKD